MSNYCTLNGINCDFANQYGGCTITACIKIDAISNVGKTIGTSLVYSKTYEEEMEEARKVSVAESYLTNMGVQIKTNYGFYRDTYDILKDLGEILSKQKK